MLPGEIAFLLCLYNSLQSYVCRLQIYLIVLLTIFSLYQKHNLLFLVGKIELRMSQNIIDGGI